MKLESNPLVAAGLLLLGALSTSGCSHMAPVADFGAASAAFTDRYRPFVSGVNGTCVTRLGYAQLTAVGGYDIVAARKQVAEQCSPLVNSAPVALRFADAVDAYGLALASLAGAKPGVLDGDIGALAGAASALQLPGGATVFQQADVDAASRLATAVAQIIVEQRVRKLTRELLRDNQESLRTTVRAMKFFAVKTYRGELTGTVDQLDATRLVVLDSAKAADVRQVPDRLPYRLAQDKLQADIDAARSTIVVVNQFGDAADALIAAHEALLDKFDTLSGLERLQAVVDFSTKVRAIRDNAVTLF